MRINLFKSLILGCLALSSFSFSQAYAQVSYVNVSVINNTQNITYNLFNYSKTPSCFFGEQPGQIPPQSSAAFSGTFTGSCTIGFQLQNLNNPNCGESSVAQFGHCYVAKFTYTEGQRVPKISITDNSHPCLKTCRIEYDPQQNSGTIKLIITLGQ